MANQEAHIVRTRIAHERQRDAVLVAEDGSLPSAEFTNNPETNNTDEGLARELARRVLGHAPSLQSAQRRPGSVTYDFVTDNRYSTTPSAGYRWHTEPTESAVEA
jgi:hypothetical protein